MSEASSTVIYIDISDIFSSESTAGDARSSYMESRRTIREKLQQLRQNRISKYYM